MTFASIRLADGNQEAVPVTWLNDNICKWPGYKSKVIQILAKQEALPQKTWDCLPVQILGIYETYDDAKRSVGKRKRDTDEDSDMSEPFSDSIEPTSPSKLLPEERNEINTSSSVAQTMGISFIQELTESKESDSVEFSSLSRSLFEERNEVNSNSSVTQPLVVSLSKELSDSKDSERGKIILEELKFVRKSLKQILQNQKKILSFLPVGAVAVVQEECSMEPITLPFQLPISDLNDLREAEECLERDENLRKQLVDYLKKVGGIKLPDMVRRLLRKLLTDTVAQNFSWLGAKGKKPFCDLCISKIIFDAVQKSVKFCNATDCEIQIIVKDWLRHAPNRGKPKKVFITV